MKGARLAGVVLVITSATFAALAGPPVAIDHVCADTEATAQTCVSANVRMCRSTGVFAACTCAPGQVAKKGACTDDPSAPSPASCVVLDAKIAAAMNAKIDVGSLENPALPGFVAGSPSDVVGLLDSKLATLTADETVKLAAAHTSIEGADAYQAAQLPSAKAAAWITKRDLALSRSIEVRKSFVARFSGDPRLSSERIALARSLLRRAAYTGVSAAVAIDRSSAESLLVAVVADASGTTPARTAAFMLGESALRGNDWKKALGYDENVVKWSMPKIDADDHAYLAAAYARIAQAHLALNDASGAKAVLASAISSGFACSPRAECVSAWSAARAVLAATWAETGSAARTMIATLIVGQLTHQERVLPLVQLADRYASSTGAACIAAAEEARAYAQITK